MPGISFPSAMKPIVYGPKIVLLVQEVLRTPSRTLLSELYISTPSSAIELEIGTNRFWIRLKSMTITTHLDSCGWYAACTSITQTPLGPCNSTRPETMNVPRGAGADGDFQFFARFLLKAIVTIAISVLGFGIAGKGQRIFARSEPADIGEDAGAGTSGCFTWGDGNADWVGSSSFFCANRGKFM